VCGARDHIRGGTETQAKLHPWMTRIYMLNEEVQDEQLVLGSDINGEGGGTIISSRYVLTAAHNVKMKNGTLREASKILIAYGTKTRFRQRVEKIIIHEDFERRDGRPIKADIALLKLSQKVQFLEDVRPVCLPGKVDAIKDIQNFEPDFNLNALYAEDVGVYISGWGQTDNVDEPRTLQAACVETEACPEALNYIKKVVCAGVNNAGAIIDTDVGDSGGPLVRNVPHINGEHNSFVQIGITSFNANPENDNVIGIGAYVKVQHYIKWINDKITEEKEADIAEGIERPPEAGEAGEHYEYDYNDD